ncbi:hypothetical protein FH608_039085 [Nonomuraea phyllanthi]|uniref:Uncharacterized protein n=1 Tax=Nonomuraea phyllanthi TaxID=2219224 RepID=A0A5C4VMP6_9ACTN|nr:hypothetical protein FH608_039085 [Nonomuraea phyllanthi]QFY12051.1 hypothetical protein GBF35_40650 [Nonomuraea phyllanthi]
MPDAHLLPPATTSKATAVATAIMHRLSDETLVTEVAKDASRTMGLPVWEPGASLYAGAAGSALAFAYAARACPDSSEHWWAQAHRWLKLAAAGTRDKPLVVPGLSDGTAGMALAVAGCDPDGRYARTLSGLHTRLSEQVGRPDLADDHDFFYPDYDVMTGPAGILGQLAPHLADPTALRVASGIVERLIARCDTAGPREHESGSLRTAPWKPWFIARKHYDRWKEEVRLNPYGFVNLGLAHGIPGPLAALSRAWLAGHRAPGLREAIRALGDQLVAASRHEDWGRTWPRVLPFDEAGEVAPDRGRPTRPSYCYGAPGIASALLDAADALGDDTMRTVAVEGFEAALRQMEDLPAAALNYPGLCHGDAGMVLICRKFATQTGSAAARSALERLVDRLLGHCDPDRPLLVRDYRPVQAAEPGSPSALDPDGTWVDNPGLLEGAAGVALTLLSVATPVPPFWARAVLVN